MISQRLFILLIFFFCSFISLHANPFEKVLPGFNEQIQFDKIDAQFINDVKQPTMDELNKKLEKIYNIPADDRTFENTVRAFDAAYSDFGKVYGILYLMNVSHPDDDTRKAANEAVIDFGKFDNELNLNENLYNSFIEYSQTEEGKSLSGSQEKFLRETIDDFKRNGFALSKEGRDKLKEINDRIALLSNEFGKNISDYKDDLIVTEDDVKGLDEAYKDARRLEDGTYKIDLSYPSYRPFMRLSESDEARKKLYMKYNNRASDKNLVVLEKLILNRKEMVEHLGYNTFSEYQLANRMAQNPKTVWEFENGLIEKVQEKGKIDYDEVLQVKRQITGNDTASVVNGWEYGYYSNILKREKYKVDSEKVKEYFEINNVMDGLFSITQSLFGITYKEVKDPSVWHQDVRLFEVFDDGKVIGRFYLDLYPRDNKYGHAACFPIINSRETKNGPEIPVAALECNFPQATDTSPALMSHSQVKTFFHEFGHVLHTLLSKTELSGQSGFNVPRDFVEAPSQIFENWTWDYPSLQMFSKHHETGEILPKELFDKMISAKNVGSGVSTLYQIFYGTIDMTLHDKYNPNETRNTTAVVKELQNKILLTPYVEGTNFQAAFGHLTGYASSYYGYLWSKVYAQDMFSVFEENGILNPEIGKRYRELILARGGEKEAIDLVKEFLGRNPNSNAFYKSLGLEPDELKEVKNEAGL
ncbi:MAG: hypothetical protein D8M58_01630 [Calditrichaeota bacterium]|nr:MAG: hypothetical protein DWQ03_05450 [Calditrichota bacterium]MBL1204068.1 hypothetical protein [Calditrichota bacterium]NOG43899.1 Zn-dependent oligopeptidase [Calditrichota bacterium]